MLEFYSVVRLVTRFACAIGPQRETRRCPAMPRIVAPVVLTLLLVGACATVPEKLPVAPPLPRYAEPPPPPVNLSGFPLEYRQGFADGCASATGAERKDVARFPADGNYRTGWQDGLAQCRKKQ